MDLPKWRAALTVAGESAASALRKDFTQHNTTIPTKTNQFSSDDPNRRRRLSSPTLLVVVLTFPRKGNPPLLLKTLESLKVSEAEIYLPSLLPFFVFICVTSFNLHPD